jgi:NAD(P)-dependent dehydrogenase (short-subunit alcohol dehydrogenase family)
VTGGSRGIGRAVALALAAEGAAVVVNGREATPAEAVAEEIRAAGGKASACIGSVADFDFAGELVEACVSAFGSIDALVNCAGIAEPESGGVLDLSPQAWREVVDVHLTGTFHTCRHALPRMLAQGGGAIVNTSSHAYTGRYGGSAYAAAKGGTNSLTFALAAELADRPVRVNAVCPGARTRLNEGPAYEARIEDLHARGVLDEMARQASLDPPPPEHVGPLYAFLVGDGAREIRGRLFSAVGGYVGVHAAPGETLLAYRDATSGPWPVAELEKRVRAALAPS